MSAIEALFREEEIGENEFGHLSPSSTTEIFNSNDISPQNLERIPNGQIKLDLPDTQVCIPGQLRLDQIESDWSEAKRVMNFSTTAQRRTPYIGTSIPARSK